MTVQLEYINHLLQRFKNVSYYAGIMLNAFSYLLCSKLCWHNWLVRDAHICTQRNMLDQCIKIPHTAHKTGRYAGSQPMYQ